jgi:LPXTG-motif cell wall-anchored protein
MGTGARGGGRRFGSKLWLILFGLAGLGVGVWLFGRRRKRSGGSGRG